MNSSFHRVYLLCKKSRSQSTTTMTSACNEDLEMANNLVDSGTMDFHRIDLDCYRLSYNAIDIAIHKDFVVFGGHR